MLLVLPITGDATTIVTSPLAGNALARSKVFQELTWNKHKKRIMQADYHSHRNHSWLITLAASWVLRIVFASSNLRCDIQIMRCGTAGGFGGSDVVELDCSTATAQTTTIMYGVHLETLPDYSWNHAYLHHFLSEWFGSWTAFLKQDSFWYFVQLSRRKFSLKFWLAALYKKSLYKSFTNQTSVTVALSQTIDSPVLTPWTV